jgi:hypothetical protein
MNVRIFVQEAGLPPSTEFEDIPNGNEALVPDVGDTVQLQSMKSPKVVSVRHFKYLDSETLEVRLEVQPVVSA